MNPTVTIHLDLWTQVIIAAAEASRHLRGGSEAEEQVAQQLTDSMLAAVEDTGKHEKAA